MYIHPHSSKKNKVLHKISFIPIPGVHQETLPICSIKVLVYLLHWRGLILQVLNDSWKLKYTESLTFLLILCKIDEAWVLEEFCFPFRVFTVCLLSACMSFYVDICPSDAFSVPSVIFNKKCEREREKSRNRLIEPPQPATQETEISILALITVPSL